MEEISPMSLPDSISFTNNPHAGHRIKQKMFVGNMPGEKVEFPPLTHRSSKSLAGLVGGDVSVSQGSAAQGLVERSSGSGIKAVSSSARPDLRVEPGEEVQQPAPAGVLLPSLAGPAPERMLVIPAGGLGKSANRTPRSSPKKGSHSRTPSGAISIDMNARSGNRTPTRTPTRELDRLHVENRAPPRYICPISGRIMRDPVILGTGTTCDRGALERYLAKGHKRCPVTKRPLKKPIHLMPNIELRQNITTWAKRNAPWILDKDGHLISNDPDPKELQGNDPQYVTPVMDDDGGRRSESGRSNSISRIEGGKSSWKYTNGTKVRPGAMEYNINASSAPWQANRGIASAPRSMRRHRSVSRSISPTKRVKRTRDWYSTGFLAVISVVNLILFIMSLWKNSWQMAPMTINPWFGASAEALADVGGQALPLMEGPGKQYWRLLSSMFLPAGCIHMVVAIAGLWLYGRYAQLALPLPQVSIAGIYLLSGLVGALASANLDANYLTCGAFAGVLGLLGTVCVDQALNFGTRRLFNFKEWWLVGGILLVNLGALITVSLLPMAGIWYSAGAFLAGLFLSSILLLLPRVGRGKPGNVKWASMQIISSLLLVGIFTAAVVGIAMPTKVGESVSALKNGSCVDFGAMQCIPYGYLPNGCGINIPTNGTSSYTITCPTSAQVTLPSDIQIQLGNVNETTALCSQYCQELAPAPAPGWAPTNVITVGAENPAPAPTKAVPVDAAASAPAASFTVPETVVPTTTIPTNTIPTNFVPTTTPTPTPTTSDPATLLQDPSVANAATNVLSGNGIGRKLRAGLRRRGN